VKPPFDPLAVAGELATFLRSYKVETVQADKYAGAWVTDAFRRHGVAVARDAEAKSVLYLSALPKFIAQAVDLLDLPKAAGAVGRPPHPSFMRALSAPNPDETRPVDG
jgi:stage V sporulation protein SpoVS